MTDVEPWFIFDSKQSATR